MKGLNDRSNRLFMRLIDQMAGELEIRISIDPGYTLQLTLVETDIYVNPRKTIVANLYNLVFSDNPSLKTQEIGMQFLVVDQRSKEDVTEPIQIFPVTYRRHESKIYNEGVVIVQKQVREVNPIWQKEKARFANQWFKELEEFGYFKEFLPEKNNSENMVCVCGNDASQEGFVFCDQTGNPLGEQDQAQPYILCQHCNRIIDSTTYEVVNQIKEGAKIKNQKLTYHIHQPLTTMNYPEKAKLFHVLCRDVIRAYLAFVQDTAQTVIESDGAKIQSTFNETLTPLAWKTIAKKVSQLITTSMNRLTEDSDLFAKELFTGYPQKFLMHCLQQYISDCENQRVCRGIEFIFDL